MCARCWQNSLQQLLDRERRCHTSVFSGGNLCCPERPGRGPAYNGATCTDSILESVSLVFTSSKKSILKSPVLERMRQWTLLQLEETMKVRFTSVLQIKLHLFFPSFGPNLFNSSSRISFVFTVYTLVALDNRSHHLMPETFPEIRASDICLSHLWKTLTVYSWKLIFVLFWETCLAMAWQWVEVKCNFARFCSVGHSKWILGLWLAQRRSFGFPWNLRGHGCYLLASGAFCKINI